MFDHVTIRVSDRAASERFYTTVLGREPKRGEMYTEWGDFSLAQADDEFPVTRHLHVGFSAAGHAFGEAGVDGGLMLDPDGNRVQVNVAEPKTGIDHLWIRVADTQTAKAFYAAAAPYTGFHLGDDTPERVQFRGTDGTVSLIAGTPVTAHVHVAFGATDDATVDAFHAALTGAGHRDNGAPGERAIYHPGYYGSFVLDPDGHNIEVVNHHR